MHVRSNGIWLALARFAKVSLPWLWMYFVGKGTLSMFDSRPPNERLWETGGWSGCMLRPIAVVCAMIALCLAPQVPGATSSLMVE